jgi:predicted nucleic acid-binding protein
MIADSSGLISAYVSKDQNHKIAVRIKQKLENSLGAIYIPSEVFAETINIVGKKLGHKTSIKLAEGILTTKVFLVVESNEGIRAFALNKFQNQPESVSFIDCLVMAFADFYETREIFGFDEAFRKNGYTRIGIDTKS